MFTLIRQEVYIDKTFSDLVSMANARQLFINDCVQIPNGQIISGQAFVDHYINRPLGSFRALWDEGAAVFNSLPPAGKFIVGGLGVLAGAAVVAKLIPPGPYEGYYLTKKGGTKYIGITKRGEKRMQEHVRDGKDFDTMQTIGNFNNFEKAHYWEREELQNFRDDNDGYNPDYNQTWNG